MILQSDIIRIAQRRWTACIGEARVAAVGSATSASARRCVDGFLLFLIGQIELSVAGPIRAVLIDTEGQAMARRRNAFVAPGE
jgi:hypothetical protein